MTEEVSEIIKSTDVAVVATLNEDGSPYVTPVTYTYKDKKLTWRSSPEAAHSKNIQRDNRVSVSIVENAQDKKRGIYINTTADAMGNQVFIEKWQQTLQDYSVALGVYDEGKSTPGRFYFRGESI